MQERIQASFDTQGLMATLGARLAHVAEGEVHIALPFSARLSQQHGYVHAGAVSSIVDSACGYAAMTKVPEGVEVVTAEFKINLMRPAIGAYFLAIGRVLNAGRSLTVCTGEVRAYAQTPPESTAASTHPQGDYKVVAIIQATIANVRPQAGAGTSP